MSSSEELSGNFWTRERTSCLALMFLIHHDNTIGSHAAVSRTLQEVALSGFTVELIAFHHDPTTRKDHIRHAFDLDAFEHGVVHAHVMRFRADGVLAVGIEDDEISITSDRDGSFARIETENPGWSCGDKLHEAVHAKAAFADRAGLHEAHAVLDARSAVGDFGEIVFAHFLLLLETERTMVGGNNLQMVLLQAVPELFLVPLLAQRRRENILGSFESGLVHVVDGEIQILRTRFRVHPQSPIAAFAHFFKSAFAAHM